MLSRPILALIGLAALLGGCRIAQPTTTPAPPPTTPPTAAVARPVIVHLFEWRWDDVAQECETFLGPAGYKAVQVSPPSENALVRSPNRPWWERYQPASYRLETRSGNRTQFADMVRRCQAAGVEIYADVILNHMTGVYTGTGVAGSTFGEYSYPGLYTPADFHQCGLTPGHEIQNWQDPVQVRTCELVNLSDLRTEAENVQARLAAYLNDLLGLGVAGFRIDAARHIDPADLQAIFRRLQGTPYIYQEVIDLDPKAPWAFAHLAAGVVKEFRYSYTISDVFRKGELARLHGPGSIWTEATWLPSDRTVVFINNHDNQRGHGAGGGVVTFKDGALHDLATAFMLAYPYGRPRVMSSYAFEADWQGPPMNPDETTKRVHDGERLHCQDNEWQCEHRRPIIAGMVGFSNAVTPADSVAHWWTNGRGQIAFSRGRRGFFAVNVEDQPLQAMLQTGLPAGTYCNVTVSTGPGCPTVQVQADGTAALTLPPMQALALHTGAPL